jgi:hypothetical protein
MNVYKIEVKSHKENVGKLFLVISELSKGFIKDIVAPLTPYQVKIEDFVIKQGLLFLPFEGFLKELSELKLRTKIARNVTEVTEGNLGVFYKRPNLDLNIWVGDSGEVRTYVNNMTWKDLNYMFPEQFKLDLKSKKPFFQGELYLDLIDNRLWKFHYVVKTDKVIYEEIVLND